MHDESEVMSQIGEALEDLLGAGFDPQSDLSPETSLLYDLDLESIEVLTLIVRIDPSLSLEQVLADVHAGADLTLADLVRRVAELQRKGPAAQ